MRARRKRSALALGAALSAVLVSLAVVGPLRAEPMGSSQFVAVTRQALSLRSLESLRVQVGVLARNIADVRAGITGVRYQVAGAEAALRAAEAALRAKRGELARRARDVESVLQQGAARRRPDRGPLTLRQATEPLQVASAALHAGDELAVEILSQAADTAQRQTSLEGLLTQVRAQKFRLAELEREVSAKLVAAQQAARLAGAVTPTDPQADDPWGVIADAQAELHEMQNQELELRTVETELLSEQVAQTERRQALLDELEAIRHRTEELFLDMAQAESIVSAWLPLMRTLPGAGEVAVEGVLRVCPVDEPHVYSDDWDAPRWAGGFHLHQGNDVFAPYGTPIRAPFDGVAVITSNTLGGRAVSVYGKTGYVYNAHLSRYEEASLGPVTAGTIIGYVGDSGDARGTAPHDHFEWHPGNGSAVDPYPYLNAVC